MTMISFPLLTVEQAIKIQISRSYLPCIVYRRHNPPSDKFLVFHFFFPLSVFKFLLIIFSKIRFLSFQKINLLVLCARKNFGKSELILWTVSVITENCETHFVSSYEGIDLLEQFQVPISYIKFSRALEMYLWSKKKYIQMCIISCFSL